MKDCSTITIKKTIKKRIDKHKKQSQSYNSVFTEILDHIEDKGDGNEGNKKKGQ